MPKLERDRKAAAEERLAANAARAKLEVDVTDLEEQIEKHAQTQAISAVVLPLTPVCDSPPWELLRHDVGPKAPRVGPDITRQAKSEAISAVQAPDLCREKSCYLPALLVSIRNAGCATVITAHYHKRASRQSLLVSTRS